MTLHTVVEMRSRSCPSGMIDIGSLILSQPYVSLLCSRRARNNASCNKRCQGKISPKNARGNNLVSTREVSAVHVPVSPMGERDDGAARRLDKQSVPWSDFFEGHATALLGVGCLLVSKSDRVIRCV